MYQRLILKNIHLLNYSILKGILENQNIFLNDNEAIATVNIVKENADKLLNGDYKDSFDTLKGKVSDNNYKLLYDLYFNKINKIS
ncbi:MAG: hypothetical protein J6B89_01230 [Bacilli bacterium]|nr:hypothetical protein [Bacilli bacterium]